MLYICTIATLFMKLTKSAVVYQFTVSLSFCHPSLSVNVQSMWTPTKYHVLLQ